MQTDYPQTSENTLQRSNMNKKVNKIIKKFECPANSLIIGMDIGGTLTKLTYISTAQETKSLESYIADRVEHQIIKVGDKNRIINAKFLNKYRREILEEFKAKLTEFKDSKINVEISLTGGGALKYKKNIEVSIYPFWRAKTCQIF